LNLFDELPEEGERSISEPFGATMWGGTVYEIAPGKRASRYHWHVGEEEWLLVVSGTPTLRTPEGEQVLRPWDVAVFVRGEAGAHEVRNDSDEPVRVLMLSNTSDPEVTVYPESGEVGVFADWSRTDRAELRILAPYPGRAE
jgi:uncharacterized cupin superfamily protein